MGNFKLVISEKICTAASDEVTDTVADEKWSEKYSSALNQGGKGDIRGDVSIFGTGICKVDMMALAWEIKPMGWEDALRGK